MKNATQKLTPAQAKIVEAVRSGKLTYAQTGNVEGNIVRRLVDRGVIVAAQHGCERAPLWFPMNKSFAVRWVSGLSVNEGALS
jgi:hypothetical protein